MRTCEHGVPIGECSCTADRCSSCGGEYDAEGWCANYCTDDEPEQERVSDKVPSSKEPTAL